MPSGTRPRPARRRLVGAAVLAVPVLLVGCGTEVPPAEPTPSGSPVPADPAAARDQLAGLAAAAQDRHFTALYRLSVADQPDRTVTVTSAADGTWRIDIPAGALGGTADISLGRTAEGIFQCALPTGQRPELVGCVRVADPDGELPRRIDPRVHHPFTDWLSVLTDRNASLSVSVSRPLAGAKGSCFSVESTSASLSAPLDVGIYCFDADGTLTAARAAFGSLLLAGTPTAPPPTVTLAGPMVARRPLGLAAQPTPTGDTSAGTS